MNKFSLLFLAAGSLLLTASVASAGSHLNGLATNGLATNGLTANGLTQNGISVNGLTANGLTQNGVKSNGVQPAAAAGGDARIDGIILPIAR